MPIGKAGKRRGNIGSASKTGPIGKSKQRHHGTKFMTTFTGAKVNYPTTTTTA